MGFIDKLASSPVGKVAGGYMEAEIGKKKEEARIKEEKDNQFADINKSIVSNLATLEMNSIIEARGKKDLYEQLQNWALGKFGDAGYAIAERAAKDGAIDGSKTFQDVLTYMTSTYGANLPEGSEPWWMQPEWEKYAEANKDYRASNNVYQEQIDKATNNISSILQNNGLGEYSFQFLTDTKSTSPKQPVIPASDGVPVVADSGTVDTSAEEVIAGGDISLPDAPTIINRGIVGFDNSNYMKQVSNYVDRAFPDIQDMFIMDRTGQLSLNKEAFAADMSKYNRVNNMYDYINNTLTEVNNAYSTGAIDTVGNQYADFKQFFNPKDFNEMGFVQKALEEYSSVVSGQEAEIIKSNIIKSDLNSSINDGSFPEYLIADLSAKLDESFPAQPGSPLSWEQLYLSNVGLENSSFKKAFNEVVNEYFSEKLKLGKYQVPGKGHSMQFIDTEKSVKDILGTNIPPGMDGKSNYFEFWRNTISGKSDAEYGSVSIDETLNEIAPKNYSQLIAAKNELGIDLGDNQQWDASDMTLRESGLIKPQSENITRFNVENAATEKLKKTNVKQIEGLPPVAGSILLNTNIRTTADVLTFIDQNNQDTAKMKTQIMGFIINDMIAGNLPRMNGLQMSDIADQVLLDIGTFIQETYESKPTEVIENITDETIDENEDAIETNVTDTKKDNIELETALNEANIATDAEPIAVEKGVGKEPWLFADGSFNPDWDGELEGSSIIQGSQSNKYYKAKQKYEKEQRKLKQDQEAKNRQENAEKAINWIKNIDWFATAQEKKQKRKKRK